MEIIKETNDSFLLVNKWFKKVTKSIILHKNEGIKNKMLQNYR